MIPGDRDLTEQGDVRLFIGVPLPEEVQLHLASIQQTVANRSGRAVRWAAVETLHLTIEFLGEVPRWVAADLPAAIERALPKTGPISLSTGSLGVFPSWAKPKVVWIGIEGEIPKLASLRKRVNESLREFSFAADPRPYQPHLTLGRVRNGAEVAQVDRFRTFASGWKPASLTFTIDRVVLFRSILAPAGPTHIEVTGWGL